MIFHSKPHNLTLTIRQTQIEGHFTKYLTSTPQSGQGHQKQAKSENSHSQEEPEEALQLNVRQCTDGILEQKKGTLGKN